MTQPATAAEVKRRLREVLKNGQVIYWDHAAQEMANDGIASADVEHVLCGGVVEPDGNPLRWRVRASKVYVVVEFDEEDDLTVSIVTAWRKK